MITISKFTRKDIPLWDSIIRSNPVLSPYQSIDFLLKYKKTARLGRKRLFYSNRIFKIDIDGQVVFVPLSIDRIKKSVYLLGDFSAVGYCDLVYNSNITPEVFSSVLAALRQHFKGYTFKFNKINEKTQFCQYLLSIGQPRLEIECVNLPLGDDANSYYNMLSKNARQNIRTAYNRLNRDEKSFDFEVISGDKRLISKQKNSISKIYAHRMKTKLGNQTLPFPLIFLSQRYFNSMVKLLNNSGNQFHALLYIDGTLAAYMSGLFSEDSSKIVVPKLAMNDQFNFYDPGIVLIYETIKYLCANYPNIDLDLSRGNEKYKYMMGGKTHLNYFFDI